MSNIQKRKQIQRMVHDVCTLSDNQQVAKVIRSPGSHLHEVETSTEEKFLASLPTLFRKTMWVKNGSFVIIEPIEEGKKVKGEIVKILTKEHIKELKEEGSWPERFDEEKSEANNDDKKEHKGVEKVENKKSRNSVDSDSHSDSDNDDDLFVNVNRRYVEKYSCSDDDSTDDSEDSSESDDYIEDNESNVNTENTEHDENIKQNISNK